MKKPVFCQRQGNGFLVCLLFFAAITVNRIEKIAVLLPMRNQLEAAMVTDRRLLAKPAIQ